MRGSAEVGVEGPPDQTHYHLQLYVAGDEPNSRAARETLLRLCEGNLHGDYVLEVIDVMENPKEALENRILVAPTLIVTTPQRRVVLVGSLSDTRKLRNLLGIPALRRDT